MSLKSGDLFPENVVSDIFNKVKGHSTLARLSNQQAIPLAGEKEFIFNLEGNAQIVGEGEKKKDDKAVMDSRVNKPVKIVYQPRMTTQYKYVALECQKQY